MYRELQRQGHDVELVGVVDANRAVAESVGREYGCKALSGLEELFGRANAASVVVPTVHHLGVAAALLAAGIDVLIEKPLATNLDEADELARLAQANNRIVQVGHLERFNPAVRATAPLITRPMFFEVHRLSIFTPRSLDIDVILDLMIHDIDVVLSFVKSPVTEVRAVGLPVVTGKVDIANVRMEFESGCVANLTASRISTERVRKLRFFQPREYISVDYGRQDVLQYRVTEQQKFSLDRLLEMAGNASVSPIPGVAVHRPAVSKEEPLHAELKSFLESVRTRSRTEVSLEDGRNALELALRVLSSIQEHSRRSGILSL